MSASTPPSGKPAKHLSGRLAQWPFQIIAPAGRASDLKRPLRDRFPELLPRKPYATDHLELGLSIMPRPRALRRRHIQLNGPSAFVWMTHDIDQREAWLVHDDAYVPQPNVIVLNPANGHAHASYLLAVPVARHAASREAPLRYFAAVERGIARRIGADRRYCGLIAKNPLHPDWRVEWRRNEPYTLEELADWLFPRDMAPDTSIEVTHGAGRNCSIFDALRATAYREVRDYKRLGDLEAFRDRLDRLAVDINNAFSVPIGPCEVRAIVRSVSRWSWKHFSDAGFSRRQSVLGRRGAAARWAGHISAEETKPWIADGISRRTWYRRRRLQS